MIRPKAEERSAAEATHATSSIRLLVTADLRVMFGQGRLEEKVPKWLEPDEPVLALAFSTHAGRWWQEVRATKSGRLIVATDRRLKLLPGGVLLAEDLAAEVKHPEPESLPYSEIQGIEAKLGRWESKLDIFTVSRTVRLTSMRAKGASAVADIVRAHI